MIRSNNFCRSPRGTGLWSTLRTITTMDRWLLHLSLRQMSCSPKSVQSRLGLKRKHYWRLFFPTLHVPQTSRRSDLHITRTTFLPLIERNPGSRSHLYFNFNLLIANCCFICQTVVTSRFRTTSEPSLIMSRPSKGKAKAVIAPGSNWLALQAVSILCTMKILSMHFLTALYRKDYTQKHEIIDPKKADLYHSISGGIGTVAG